MNALQAGNCIPADVIKDPNILANDPYPQRVHDWYIDTIDGKFEKGPHLKEVRWLLRESAFAEMWRVLAFGGKITVVDHKDIIDWVVKEFHEIFSTTRNKPDVYFSSFNQLDMARSSSLRNIMQKGGKPKKVILKKLSTN